ncbi:2-octaprenyl-6-methoxyphenol hydroxylase [Vibrio nigripulchritudo MADA3029]|uniref:2-octaprenyl-6-methoxyphenyl hydroxylase n=1 Tax=Vibrio nigripulchritudo TaxID=28173 RepID=UPI0003B238D1|nr:2-octaprenyl-6-methoxyphenyl hydroxylase [Vibrio nigripulchritudo]CCN50584.1 2-octaprenyl-6-methoxyphenol hydroxylase [Vibrio nigripulchritudo MADA3020]CCN53880.1 2-octaprenyl-6-methoxyphenol hydroxylase [Vibrio nigripulchritudo MADA3021]CCN59870.1 2-octaprenyl-6-methoxyphenol hydroxylase [Vibrio nigripulchritudo MADA3029]
MKQYDVVIAGGAMAGATLALALEQHSDSSLSIAVIEPHKVEHTSHPGYDARSIALSHGTSLLLEKMSLWEQVRPLATPIEHIHVSDRSHAGIANIDKSDVSLPALGYVVELADVGRIYQSRLDAAPNIDFLCPESVKAVERHTEKVIITLASGENIEAKLLVAADGALSPSAQSLNLPLSEHDFEQVALIANISLSQPHQGQAFERFTDSGPLALLPMSDNRMSLVWCLRPDKVEEVLSMPDDAFLTALQKSFGWRLGEFTKVGERASYPLLMRSRDQIISHRFAAVGNAAQTLHPIAGQGFNLGIRDVASLAEQINKHLEDPGHYSVLSAYRTRREQDRNKTMDLTSGLVHLFSNDYVPMRVGRNLGLMAFEASGAAKASLLARALGMVER